MKSISSYFLLGLLTFFFSTDAADTSRKFEVIEQKKPDSNCVMGCQVGVHEVCTGIFDIQDASPKLLLVTQEKTDAIQDFPLHIKEVLADLKKEHGIEVKKACFACPGTTHPDKRCIAFYHLPFKEVNGYDICQETNLTSAVVLNDFELTAYGIPKVPRNTGTVLHKGIPQGANSTTKKILVVGAGSGLGTALLTLSKYTADTVTPIGCSLSEFGAQTPMELQFKDFIMQKVGCASWGKVLGSSGGVQAIYDFLQATYATGVPKKTFSSYTEIFDQKDNDDVCKIAVHLYMQLYATCIRNLMYTHQPSNGVCITNTIAQQYPELFNQQFVHNVLTPSCHKNTESYDYLSRHLNSIPLYLMKEKRSALYGAARYLAIQDVIAQTKDKK